MLLKHLSIPLLSILPATAHEAQKPIANEPWLAPLKCPFEPKVIVPESFAVRLAPGHSLKEHIKVVGKKFVPWYVFRHDKNEDQVMYFGDGIDDKLLEMIRRDSGVEMVFCDAKGLRFD